MVTQTIEGKPGGQQRGQYMVRVGWAVINGIRVVSEGDVPVRRLSLKGGGQETGCRKDGSRRGWIKGSHIDWRRERVPVVTLGIEGGGL